MYSDGSFFDHRAKMSTSRKLRAKLVKHRRSVRKATSTEAARKEPEPEPAESPTAETQASTEREQSAPALRSQELNLFAFAIGCQAKNYLQDFVHLHISELTPGPSGTERQTTPRPQKRSSGAATAGR